MAVPENMPAETVREILRGVMTRVFEAEAIITGGHSINVRGA
jgi:selenide,water dikinase